MVPQTSTYEAQSSSKSEVIVPQFLVIDDHEAILAGTLPALQEKYPTANIEIAQTAQAAERKVSSQQPDLAIVDLRLPATDRSPATVETGMRLLEDLMGSELAPNIVVLSINVKPLIRIKPAINAYAGGFVAMDKSFPIQDMLHSVDIALRGSTYLPPEVRTRPEFDRKWLRVLQLKYQDGLSDRAIARAMGISDRTVRNYWVRIQDALNIYDDPSKDLRVQIELAARKVGLIE